MLSLLNRVCCLSTQRVAQTSTWTRCWLCLRRKSEVLQAKRISDFASDFSGIKPSHATRLLARTIRSEIKDNNVRGSVSVVHSILQGPLKPRIKPLKRTCQDIDFRRALPSRLVTHTLIHCLLRKGLLVDAASEVRRMIGLGHRFHPRTLQAIFGFLCTNNLTTELPASDAEHLSVSPNDTETARLVASQSHSLPSQLREGVNLLLTIRLSHHRRTKDMFDQLIDACLLQGQIVVATLLFVLMVKDWQLRKAMQGSCSEIQGSKPDNVAMEQLQMCLVNVGSPSFRVAKHLARSNIMPDSAILARILRLLNEVILLSGASENSMLECIESLLILSELLRDGSFAGSQTSYLIRMLQNCPSSPTLLTGIVRNGQYIVVTAYDSIHTTLKLICTNPPSKIRRATLADPRVSPPMEFSAYTALLHYALRHRFSPDLANSILMHMTLQREPPLQPNITVYNILLRSSSLLRRNDVAKQILDRLQQGSEGLAVNHGKGLENMLRKTTRHDVCHIPIYSGSFAKTLRRRRRPLDLSPLTAAENVAADMYTLTSYITHLVSIGHPELVIDIIEQLFPELLLQKPATRNGKPLSKKQKFQNYQNSIARGVQYGPHVFCALLNALGKAGRTGFAERIYELAKYAERASWNSTGELGHSLPWLLPIHAYTSMLQCYADESRKALGYNIGYTKRPMQKNYPIGTLKNKIFVQGWGSVISRTLVKESGDDSSKSLLRNTIARRSSWQLYESLLRETYLVWQDLIRARQQQVERYPPEWSMQLRQQMPVPDQRFFNVLLHIFGRRPRMQMRRCQYRPSWWRRKLRAAKEAFGRRGRLCMTYDPLLLEIAKSMSEYGYELPLGFQRLLVGRPALIIEQGSSHRKRIAPYAFTRILAPKFQAFSVSVKKERGLPIKRNYRRSM